MKMTFNENKIKDQLNVLLENLKNKMEQHFSKLFASSCIYLAKLPILITTDALTNKFRIWGSIDKKAQAGDIQVRC